MEEELEQQIKAIKRRIAELQLKQPDSQNSSDSTPRSLEKMIRELNSKILRMETEIKALNVNCDFLRRREETVHGQLVFILGHLQTNIQAINQLQQQLNPQGNLQPNDFTDDSGFSSEDD